MIVVTSLTTNQTTNLLVEYVQIIGSYPDGLNEELPSLLAIGTKVQP